jgi:hypothetical protein
VVPLHGRRCHARGGKLGATPSRRIELSRSFPDGQCMATNMDGMLSLASRGCLRSARRCSRVCD